MHALGEGSGERAHGAERRLAGRAVDQVRDRFRLHEVDASVDERALGKLARVGPPRAEFEHPRKHEVKHHRAAMTLQFEDVLPGEGTRSREEEGDTAVQSGAVGIAEIAELGLSRCELPANDLLSDRRGRRSGHAYDADAAASGRRGNRRDGLRGVRCACHGLRRSPGTPSQELRPWPRRCPRVRSGR